MPKDITHWAIATIVKTNMQDKNIERVVNENYAAFLIGAVAYDIPYFSIGKYSRIFTNKANELHGLETCNTWEPLINLINKYYSLDENGELSDLILSFVLGCITHIITDSRYHPFIYYFSGNPYDRDVNKKNKAVFEHRKLEAHLDLYYLKKLNYTGPTSAKYILNQLHGPMIAEILSVLYFGNYVKRIDMTKHCLDTYKKTQSLLNNTLVKYVIKLLGMVNSEMRKRSALFYPKTIDPLYYGLFENNSQYRHPVSGELIESSLDKIYTNCIIDILSSFYKIACCKNPGEFIKAFDSFSAVSLETGNECTSPSLMRYFSNNLIPRS